MAETVGTLATELLRRVRDPNGLAHARADVRNLLSHCQRIINAHTDAVLTTEDITVPAGSVFLSLAVDASTIDRLSSVRVDGRDLPCVPWNTLQHHDRQWPRATSDIPMVWTPIGRTMFVVWPAPRTTITVTLVGVKATASLASSDSLTTDVRDTHMPALLNIAEQVVLLRHRLMASAAIARDRLPTVGEAGAL